ncbi:MAG: hypothetical protein J5845_02445 [Lachnospiraceae bacterium]|nr:hypothetical protein [Lachnospiraceae bacterium]MBR5667493.1 hypothetical protein [Lachnospiraceae bacterium]
MKKKQFRLTRKQFFIILSALLAVVVIAETVLLAKTFAGKKSSKKTPKGTSTKEATPSPVPQDVRKVARVDFREIRPDGYTSCKVFTYDELGRETMAEIYINGELRTVEMTSYYNTGSKRETLRVAESDEVNAGELTLSSVVFMDDFGDVLQEYAMDSIVTSEQFDDDGHLVEIVFSVARNNTFRNDSISWKYSGDVVTERTVTKGDGQTARREYDYDESGRVCAVREYRTENGKEEGKPYTAEITYDGNRRTETVNRNGVINENVYLNGALSSCKFTYPEGDVLEYEYLIIPEFGKLARTEFGTPYHQLCCVRQRHEEEEVTMVNPEYDSENRVITARDEGVTTGNYYRRFRYSYGENGRLDTFYIDVLTYSDILEYTTEYHYHYDAFGDVDSILIYTSDGEQPVSEVTIEWITVPGTVQ